MSGNATLVRAAEAEDAAAISRVAAASWRDAYAGILDPAYIDHELREGYEPSALSREIGHLDDGGATCFLVAEREGAIVGYLHFEPSEDGPCLRRLYVHPDHCGTGVGTALVEELHERIGPEASYTLDVHPRNERARRFYARHGYESAGRLPPPFSLRLRRRGAAAHPA